VIYHHNPQVISETRQATAAAPDVHLHQSTVPARHLQPTHDREPRSSLTESAPGFARVAGSTWRGLASPTLDYSRPPTNGHDRRRTSFQAAAKPDATS
jgi:hypothetical protein